METENKNKKNQIWKSVLIGGVPGILMGSAGTMMASNVVTPVEPEPVDPESPETPLEDVDVPVAVVSDDQSFAQAFADAREQVGPGGVFVWHGNIYNTYTAQEWAAMSQEERDHFVAQSLDADYDIPVVEPDTPVAPVTPEEPEPVKPEPVEPISPEEPEVVFLGSETVVNEDGTVVTLEHYNIDGHAAIVADVDGDMSADVLAVDLNDNMVIDDDEIQPIVPEEQYAANDSNDMPDYVNDADTSAFA